MFCSATTKVPAATATTPSFVEVSAATTFDESSATVHRCDPPCLAWPGRQSHSSDASVLGSILTTPEKLFNLHYMVPGRVVEWCQPSDQGR